MPSLPTSKRVRVWIDQEMKLMGLTFNNSGAAVSFKVTVLRLARKILGGSRLGPSQPAITIQIVADSVRVFRQTMVTTVGIRVLSDQDDYNSMTSMHLL